MTDKPKTAAELADELFIDMQHQHDRGADNGIALVECVERILAQGRREGVEVTMKKYGLDLIAETCKSETEGGGAMTDKPETRTAASWASILYQTGGTYDDTVEEILAQGRREGAESHKVEAWNRVVMQKQRMHDALFLAWLDEVISETEV